MHAVLVGKPLLFERRFVQQTWPDFLFQVRWDEEGGGNLFWCSVAVRGNSLSSKYIQTCKKPGVSLLLPTRNDFIGIACFIWSEGLLAL